MPATSTSPVRARRRLARLTVGALAAATLGSLGLSGEASATGTTAPAAPAAHPLGATLLAATSPTSSAGSTGSTAAPSPGGTRWQMTPGMSLAAVLARTSPGDTVVLADGVYPRQVVANRDFGGVTVTGTSRNGTILQGLYLLGVSHLRVQQLTVTTSPHDSYSAVEVTDGSAYDTFSHVSANPRKDPSQNASGFSIFSHTVGTANPPHDIAIEYCSYDGSGETAPAGHGLRIFGGDAAPQTWPHDITLQYSDLRYSEDDLIQVEGARNIRVYDNTLFHPQNNLTHNDGLQSFGSDGLVVDGNVISSPDTYYNGNHNAVILGTANPATTTYYRVTNSVVQNNLITHFNGQGIMLAGTANTVVRNNTVTGLDGPGSAFILSVGNYNAANPGAFVYNNIFDKFLRNDWNTAAWGFFDYNVVGTTTDKAIGVHSHRVAPATLFLDTTSYAVKTTSVAYRAGIPSAPGTPSSVPAVTPAAGTGGTTPDIGAR